jgi:hypothetical protein
MMHDGQEPKILGATGEDFRAFGGRCLDNYDRVAFRATLAAGGAGVFAGFDPEKDRVLVVGDELFGSTVTDVLFAGSNGCNDSGQFALRAVLADGRTVLVRADPTRGGGSAPGGPDGSGLQAASDIVSLLTADPAERRHILAEIATVPNGVANATTLVLPGGTETAAWLRPPAPVLPDSARSERVDALFEDFAAAAWLR